MNIPAWQHGLPDWPALPRLEGELTADVCVIGLGGTGLAAVGRLLDHGLNVIGLDGGSVAGAAAGRNGGLLLAGLSAFHHDAVSELGADSARAWYEATRTELERMLQETPASTRRTGSLRIAADEEEQADCQRQLELMRQHGLPALPYSGPEGHGLLFPDDAVYNPLARNRELALRAIARGARLFERSMVREIVTGAVRTALGTVRPQAVIVAVDGNLAQLVPELEGDVQPLRLQMLGTEPTAEIRLTRPVYHRWGFEYWQQLPDGRLLLGGFRDHGGEGEWGAEPVPDRKVQDLLSRYLSDSLGVSATVTHRWAAMVGYRSQILPFHGSVRPGIWALGGYNGTGNVLGSLLGRHIADQVIAAG